MIRIVETSFGRIEYCLERKNVKNINLRVKPDGSVHLSVSRFVSAKALDDFVISKAEFVFKASERFKNRKSLSRLPYYTEAEVKEEILKICKEVYPYFEKSGIEFPDIKFRKMKSRWGSCHIKKCILTFNTNLSYAPKKCIEYVVLHEFTHFLVGNHLPGFYRELEKVCPDYKERRLLLKEITKDVEL